MLARDTKAGPTACQESHSVDPAPKTTVTSWTRRTPRALQ
jgi:hypothetical protein